MRSVAKEVGEENLRRVGSRHTAESSLQTLNGWDREADAIVRDRRFLVNSEMPEDIAKRQARVAKKQKSGAGPIAIFVGVLAFVVAYFVFKTAHVSAAWSHLFTR